MKEARGNPSVAVGQREAQKREKESPLCIIDGHLSFQEAPTIQRTSRAPR